MTPLSCRAIPGQSWKLFQIKPRKMCLTCYHSNAIGLHPKEGGLWRIIMYHFCAKKGWCIFLASNELGLSVQMCATVREDKWCLVCKTGQIDPVTNWEVKTSQIWMIVSAVQLEHCPRIKHRWRCCHCWIFLQRFLLLPRILWFQLSKKIAKKIHCSEKFRTEGSQNSNTYVKPGM